jgi:3-hydroxybutyryl-CoA dehydrogenase
MPEKIKRVGVLGCGLMGHGISQVAAQAGYDVVVREVDDERLEKGLGQIEKQLARAVEKGKAEQADADAVRGRIQGTTDYGDLADTDLVIEAITEDLDLKLEMWREVDGIVKDEAYFATNTSSLPVIDQAAATKRPDRFLGLHFFNPAQVMKLVEVVRGITTSDDAFQVGLDFTKSLGKMGVQTKDKAGFIVNRLLVPYLLDGMRAYEEGVGSITEIDEAMKAGAGHPMGPLTLSDFVGLDTLGSICDVMFDEFSEKRFARPPILRKMLAAGWYGRKSGVGFYDYSGEAPGILNLYIGKAHTGCAGRERWEVGMSLRVRMACGGNCEQHSNVIDGGKCDDKCWTGQLDKVRRCQETPQRQLQRAADPLASQERGATRARIRGDRC